MPAFVVPALFGASFWAVLSRVFTGVIIFSLVKFLLKLGLVVVAYDFTTDTIDSVLSPTAWLNRASMGAFAYDVLTVMGFIDGIAILFASVSAGFGVLAANKVMRWSFAPAAAEGS